MSNTILRNALVLSLLVNVGVLAGLGWQKLSQDGLPMPSGAPTGLSRELQLSASQLQRWHDAEAPFLAYLRASNASLGEHRNRLVEAIFAEQVDRAVIDAEQAKIAELQNEQQRLLIDQLLQEREILEPQQRARLAQVLTQQSFGADSIEQLHRK
ncbi:periplasmic heavy metal sensor [Pseudomonas oligotrophica]|uniref:periplasmic heavy metal sensor n=1 Tax=Pseudomonas oligotrophica TaxID=2912055 RepID=UPI001F1F35D5|nr:periplasmic heavy metal sensor [Pseudomonas oligotrophica]MCF7201655.1 periplasmic heavy metal sensor [Pseudomonas oligotrophica]